MKNKYALIGFMTLVLAVLACNRTVPTATPVSGTPLPTTGLGESTEVVPTGIGTPTFPAVNDTPTVATDVPTFTASPSPTADTPSPVSTKPTETMPSCDFDADFVTDVTIPDDTQLAPDAVFTKTWRMHNTGTCVWGPGTLWSFDSGDKMDGPDLITVPTTQPGDTVDIVVHLAAPTTPGNYTGVWRMRRPDGETFGMSAFVRIVVTDAEVTVTATASVTPTATTEGGVEPVINYFRGDVEEADPGDSITLEWEAAGATSAILYHLMPTGQLGSFWEVGVSGTFEYEIDARERNHTDFLLTVSDDQGNPAQASLSITLRCPDTWFFTPAPDVCPASPAIESDAAEEHFEHGTMIWVMAEDMIYVLFDDGQSPHWKALGDEWDLGDPEDDPTLTPPAGLYQPVRGFGQIWREETGFRDRLGWAIDPEVAFITHVQRTSRPKYNDTYIGAVDAKIWRLLPESSGWQKLP